MSCRRSIALCFSLLVGACSGLPGQERPLWITSSGGEANVEACRDVFETIDNIVDMAGTGDAEAARMSDFPYLRSNRFLASFRNEPLNGDAFDAWVERLRDMDRVARRVELANLSPEDRVALHASLEGITNRSQDPNWTLDWCAEILAQHDLAYEEAIAALRFSARVPDNYSFWSRLVGLYPVTSIGVAAGFAQLRRHIHSTFAVPASERFVEGTLEAYYPAVRKATDGQLVPARRLTATEVASVIAESSHNPLGIPEPHGRDLMRIVETFAPVWLVDQASLADQIGHPVWHGDNGRLHVGLDLARTVAFTRLSHTRFGDEILPQISYTIWFKERPRTSSLDLLGGWLDAVIWRVTIATDGRPLVFDTIHACGCYHLFFPVAPVQRKAMPEDEDLREEALVPAVAPHAVRDERVVVRLAAGSHYVTAVDAVNDGEEAEESQLYTLIPMGEIPDLGLRSAPLPGKTNGARRSIFGPDGLISGTERLERLFLWPMGVPSPGAMRQWGTHATAFVGRRHFDDPSLLEQAFQK